MELDDIQNIDLSRGERVEIGVKRPGFSHVGSGVFLTDRIGYFGRIEKDSREEQPVKVLVEGMVVEEFGTRDVVVTYSEMYRTNSDFGGSAVKTPVDQIE